MSIKNSVQKMTKNKFLKVTFQLFMIVVGCAIMGLAYRTFYTPNEITPSGFSGLASIISDLLSRINIYLSPSIIFLIMNIVIFIIALRFFGWRFALMTLLGIFAFSVAMEYCYIPQLYTNDKLLASILGGALLGVGNATVFRAGGSTGGSDIVQLLINKFKPNIRTGTAGAITNFIVLAIGVFVYGVNSAFYAIIAIFIYGKAVDIVLSGTKSARAYYIICDKDKEVAESILKTFHRGVTRIDAEGAFSKKEKKILVCLITNHQAPLMKSIVKNIDPSAFVYSTEVHEALGESMFMKEESMYRELKLSDLIKAKHHAERKEKIEKAEAKVKLSEKLNRSNFNPIKMKPQLKATNKFKKTKVNPLTKKDDN